jgi:uncharacterized protein YbcI
MVVQDRPIVGRAVSLVAGFPFASLATLAQPDESSLPMAAPNVPLAGDELLAAVTDAMIEFHKRYYHRAPVTAKTLLLGEDLLACVLGGVYTDVEKTMIELQRSTIVQETRNAFQNAMQDKFIDAVEDLSGRRVLAFISNHHIGPDIEIELFMLGAQAQ